MRSDTSRYFCSLLLMLILGAATPIALADDTAGQQAFDAGVTASRAGNYEEALRHFLEAKRQGRDTPALYHNLGVTYLKLKRYDEAEQAFREASRSKRMAAVSYYNLGLLEERRDNQSAAEQWFQKARDAGRTPRLRRMAELKLGIRETVDVPYSGYFEVFGGYDDNPQLIDEAAETTDFKKEGDSFLGALAFGRYRFTGDEQDGAYVFSSAYSRNYLDVDEQNTAAVSAGVGLKNRVGSWQHDYQLGVNRLWLDGDEIQTGFLGSIRARRELGKNLILGFRLIGESLDGADDFDFLSGERARFRVRLQGTPSAVQWKLTYEGTYNDRDNVELLDSAGNVDDFFDISPLRHELQADLEIPLTGLLKAELGAEYRISEYSDPEVRDGVEMKEREDDRWGVNAGLAYPFGPWTARLEARYWDNDSNFDRFDYERTDVMLSLGRYF